MNQQFNYSHLDLIAFVDLFAETCWRRKTHVLELDLTLRLPAEWEKHTHTHKVFILSLATVIILQHVLLLFKYLITHLFSNATVTDPS